PNLRAGDYLLIDDGKGHSDIVRLTSAPQISDSPFASSPPASPPGTKITVVQWSAATPLHADYCAADVTVRGNLVVATHGERVSESFAVPAEGAERLRLPLSNGPLAHLDLATQALVAPAGSAAQTTAAIIQPTQRGTSALALLVDGVLWQQRPSLL